VGRSRAFSLRRSLSLFSLVALLGSQLLTPLPADAYSSFTAHSDIVEAGGYAAVTTGNANWGISGSYRSFFAVNNHQTQIIRQDGSIVRFQMYFASKPAALTAFYFQVWRKTSPTTWDLLFSEDVLSSIVGGQVNTITLATSAQVHEGDYVGYGYNANGDVPNFLLRTSGSSQSSLYVYDDSTTWFPPSSNYNWAANSVMDVYPAIKVFMSAPQSVFIGDSITSGFDNLGGVNVGTLSYVDTYANAVWYNNNPTYSFPYKAGHTMNLTYQNMGISANKASNIVSRFTQDVLNLKPRVVILQDGVNDVSGGVAKSTFISNWTIMLNAAQADSNITTIVVLKILPWTNGSNSQAQTMDDWNNSLAVLAAGYSKAIVADARSYVGQFRAGGDPGNLWDQKPTYTNDNLHFNADGHGQIARAIAEAIGSGTTISVTSSATGSTFGQAVTFTATVTPVTPGADSPTGNVTFKDGGTTLGTATLGQGSGTYPTTSLSAGTHTITAVYEGDTNYTTSTSASLTHTVTSTSLGAGGAANYWRRLYEDGIAPSDFVEWWENGSQTSSASSTSSVSSFSSSSSSSDPYRLLNTSQASSSSVSSVGASSSSAVSVQSPSRTERICARVDRWIPVDSPRRVSVLRRLAKWLGISCGG
jgi:lysophospholipase L1-like esterase